MCPTALIKKSVYQEFNGYDEKLKYIWDQDMYLRILLKHNLGILHKKLIKYRIHQTQLSGVFSLNTLNNLSIVYQHLIDFINGNNEVKLKYQVKLNKIIAKKYFRLSFNHLNFNNFYKYKYFIKKAKTYFIFPIFNIYYLLQYSDNYFSYYTNSIIYPLFKHCLKVIRNIRKLF
jgi:hypothetical protein